MAQLQHWCKGEGIDLDHALLVKDIPEDTEVGFIEETLQSIKALGRVRVRGRMYDPQLQSLTVLCECRERVIAKSIPLDVLPEHSNKPWRLVWKSVEQTEGLTEQEENVTADTKSTPQICSPEAIIRAVGDLMEKQGRFSGESGAFRRLRTFSGVLPTPPGEEQFDSWVEQARLMVETSERRDKEKSLKILESLKGPASEVVQAVRFDNPDASPQEYIDAIEKAFGTSETGEELYFAFRLLCQHPGEKLSEFLRRMERVLNKVVQRGGLSAPAANVARLDQLLKGAMGSDLMLLNLRLRGRRDSPPTFLQLLNEIRLEEGYEESRQKLKTSMRSVQVKSAITSADPEMQDRDKPTETARRDKDVKALKKEVKKLRKQVKVMAIQPAIEKSAHKHFSPAHSQPGSFSSRSPSNFFCYRCGDDGHVAAKCQAPENPQRVIQKFIHARHAVRDGRKETRGSAGDDSFNVQVNRGVINGQNGRLPRGLVGPLSTALVKVEGIKCIALIDSGSQVTIIFDSWYNRHLTHLPLHPLSGLAIWGLSGSDDSYPYRGYIQVELKLPKNMACSTEPITVLALVCPDPRCSDSTPVLVGTNVREICPLNSVTKPVSEANCMRMCVAAP
ncbi:hypothetical protein MHYP_G00328800 [Metynnis hypsauchen]